MSDPEKIVPGIYRHFKGNLYEVLDLARHSESEETYVVYRPLKGDSGTWIRPLAMFCETVTREGQTQPRFRYLAASLVELDQS